jgi:putative transposase
MRRMTRDTAENEELRVRTIDLAHARRRLGYRRIHDLLRCEDVRANHKRVYHLYRESALSVRKRRRRRQVMIDWQVLSMPSGPNEVWSIDFVMATLTNGRRIKCLTLVDEYTRECLNIAVDYGTSGGTSRTYSSASASSGSYRGRCEPVQARREALRAELKFIV